MPRLPDCYNLDMAFNHYAKIKRILDEQPNGWIIKKINRPTAVKNFKGQNITFDYYYRIYTSNGEVIKYCKFQQIERLSKILGIPVEDLPVVS